MRSAPHLTSIERTWEGSSHRAMASRLSGKMVSDTHHPEDLRTFGGSIAGGGG